MPESNAPVIACGCGRRMALDALRGRGAYRCGCGARVVITIPDPRPSCAWRLDDGTLCRTTLVASDEPVPLCRDHTKAWRAKWFPEEDQMQRYNRLGLICDCSVDQFFTNAAEYAKRQETSVVYYVRVGDLIKIGVTVNLRARLTALTLPDVELLATEPGDRRLEQQRHAEFRDLRHGGEWFRAEPRLLEHVADVLRRCGAPEASQAS